MSIAQTIKDRSLTEFDSIRLCKKKCYETKINNDSKTFIFADKSKMNFPITFDNYEFLLLGLNRALTLH